MAGSNGMTIDFSPVAKVAAATTRDEHAMPLVVQLVASIVLLIAANTCPLCTSEVGEYKIQNWAYTVAAAVIAMFSCLLGLVLLGFRTTNDKTLFKLPTGDITVGYLLACFNFVWWGIAVGIITFQNPFTDTGNGYFAAWVGFIFSVRGLGASATKMVSAASSSGPLILLGVCSLILVWATPSHIHLYAPYKGQAIYALIIAILTLVVVLVFLAMAHGGREEAYVKAKLPVLLLFSILWIILACLVTFAGPFNLTGNGYFGSWAGAVLCLQAAFLPFEATAPEQSTSTPTLLEQSTSPAEAAPSSPPSDVV